MGLPSAATLLCGSLTETLQKEHPLPRAAALQSTWFPGEETQHYSAFMPHDELLL